MQISWIIDYEHQVDISWVNSVQGEQLPSWRSRELQSSSRLLRASSSSCTASRRTWSRTSTRSSWRRARRGVAGSYGGSHAARRASSSSRLHPPSISHSPCWSARSRWWIQPSQPPRSGRKHGPSRISSSWNTSRACQGIKFPIKAFCQWWTLTRFLDGTFQSLDKNISKNPNEHMSLEIDQKMEEKLVNHCATYWDGNLWVKITNFP